MKLIQNRFETLVGTRYRDLRGLFKLETKVKTLLHNTTLLKFH